MTRAAPPSLPRFEVRIAWLAAANVPLYASVAGAPRAVYVRARVLYAPLRPPPPAAPSSSRDGGGAAPPPPPPPRRRRAGRAARSGVRIGDRCEWAESLVIAVQDDDEHDDDDHDDDEHDDDDHDRLPAARDGGGDERRGDDRDDRPRPPAAAATQEAPSASASWPKLELVLCEVRSPPST